MRETGLVDLWERWFEPDTRPCQNGGQYSSNSKNKKMKKKEKKPLARLTLTNLTGAFAFLTFGYAVSLFVFIWERIISKRNLRNKKKNCGDVIQSRFGERNFQTWWPTCCCYVWKPRGERRRESPGLSLPRDFNADTWFFQSVGDTIGCFNMKSSVKYSFLVFVIFVLIVVYYQRVGQSPSTRQFDHFA